MTATLSDRQSCSAMKPSWRYCLRLVGFFALTLSAALYLQFSPVVNPDFYNKQVLFRPQPLQWLEKRWFGRQGQEVLFTNATGVRLSGLYFPAAGAKRTILFHHGQAGNLNNHMFSLRHWMKPDVAVFAYDYAGFGRSGGSPTIAGSRADSLAAYRYLVDQLHVDPRTIVHYGVSLGSGPALALAATQPCQGLVLVSPYTSLTAAAQDRFPFMRIYPRWLMASRDYDGLMAIKQVTVPILIAHATRDLCIPVEHGLALYNAAASKKKFLSVAGAGHCEFRPGEYEHMVSFVRALPN